MYDTVQTRSGLASRQGGINAPANRIGRMGCRWLLESKSLSNPCSARDRPWRCPGLRTTNAQAQSCEAQCAARCCERRLPRFCIRRCVM